MRVTINIILLVLINSCVAQKVQEYDYNEVYGLLNATLTKGKKTEIYKRAYVSNIFDGKYLEKNLKGLLINQVNDKITQFAYQKIDSIAELSIAKKVKDSLIEKISRKYLLPKVSDFLSDEDILFMSKNADRKNTWDQKKLNQNISLTNEKKETEKVSTPMFNLKGDIAAYMIENTASLTMVFCRKEKNEWEFYCSATIWIE